METYESDIAKFLKEYKHRHPDTERRQREGRALLWDKPVDLEQQAEYRTVEVAQKPYVYDTTWPDYDGDNTPGRPAQEGMVRGP